MYKNIINKNNNNISSSNSNLKLESTLALINKFSIKANKSFGQNFLIDDNFCKKIINSACICDNDEILEIGPGPGTLSRYLIESKAQKITLIEKDKSFLELLNYIIDFYQQDKDISILNKDAIKVNLSEITNHKLNIIANLPYNIGTKLLVNWLKEIDHVKSITVMLQKEVVDRIISPINNKNYGKLSVICQLLCHTQKQFDVPADLFFPPPKVTSSVVTLKPKENISQIINNDLLRKIEFITSNCFNNRRKIIKHSMKLIFKDQADVVMNKLNIDPKLRPENISPDQYLQLAKILMKT